MCVGHYILSNPEYFCIETLLHFFFSSKMDVSVGENVGEKPNRPRIFG